MRMQIKKAVAILLVLLSCFNLFACASTQEDGAEDVQEYSVTEYNTNGTFDTDDIIEDELVGDVIVYDQETWDQYIHDNLTHDDQLYECEISDEIISDVIVIDVIVGDNTEEEIISQLPEGFEDYDIDWGKVIGKFAVGTSIIIAVGFVNTITKGTTVFIFGTPATVAKDAFVGAAIGAAVNVAMESATDKNVSKEGIKKYAIEGAADGYMWGAITSVVKRFIVPQKLHFSAGSVAKVAANGTVTSSKGKVLGKAAFSKGKIILYDTSGKPVNFFKSSGREIAEQSLPKNALVHIGEDSVANIGMTDDKGTLISVADHLQEGIRYVVNGYSYRTDALGRITSAEAPKLKLSTKPRLNIADNMQAIGKGDQLPTDHRGHLFADMFGGSNTSANIVAMDGKLNQGAYKAMEGEWKKALEQGKKVKAAIKISYEGNSYRPSKFEVTYQIDNGELITKVFENTAP